MQRTLSNISTPEGKILVDIKGLKSILSCGSPTAYEIADRAGASVKIGKRRLYNVRKIEEYLEAAAGSNPKKGA